MTGILNTLIAGVSGAVKDAYFNLVSLLLPGNGTNGAQNNTFLDGSSNNFTITRNGNTTQGTFSPFSQTGWGGYFNASNYLTATLTGQTPGTESVTYECWVYPTDLSTTRYVFNTRPVADTQTGILCQITSGGNLQITYSGLALFSGAANNIVVNQWQHIAVVRNGSTNWTVYVNGTSIGTFSNSVNLSSDYLSIGSVWTTASFLGYISNLRIVNGVVVPPSGGPTSPLTAVSGTSILTLQSNRFKDNSANNFTVTSNGSVTITPFSPFAPTQSYSASAVGGSGYFDGTGDYLTVPASTAFSFGTSPFSIETWVYLDTVSNNGSIVLNGSYGLGANSDWILRVGSSGSATGKWEFTTFFGGTAYQAISNSAVVAKTWTHIAAVRNGNTFTLYIDGVAQTTTATNTNSVGFSNQTTLIVGDNTAGVLLKGWFSNFRIVKGTAVYTGNFTPPTGQLATSGAASAAAYPSTTNVDTSFASSACSLLLNFTNAGVVDATAKNVLETVGNAQISTTQSKWGGGSISIPKTSTDYLKSNLPVTDLCAFGSGDFVIEFWLRLAAVPGSGQIGIVYDSRPSATNGAYAMLYIDNATLKYYVSSADRITGSALSINTWYYIAVARASGSTRLYIDGTQQGSTYSDSTVYLNGSQRPLIGTSGNSPSSSEAINGFIDDLRVTKGSARGYSGSTITVPTAPFPVQ